MTIAMLLRNTLSAARRLSGRGTARGREPQRAGQGG
jgi:hypothetical protein